MAKGQVHLLETEIITKKCVSYYKCTLTYEIASLPFTTNGADNSQHARTLYL